MHDITTAQTKDLNVEEIEEISVFIHHRPATGEDDFPQVDTALALCRTGLVTVFIAVRQQRVILSPPAFPTCLAHGLCNDACLQSLLPQKKRAQPPIR